MHFVHLAIILFFYVVAADKQQKNLQCGAITTPQRLDCFPEENANKDSCLLRGCCWSDKNYIDPGIPMCFFPQNYPTYSVSSVKTTPTGYFAQITKLKTTYGIDEFTKATVEVRYETKSRLRLRVTFPSEPDRWEPPLPLGQPDNPPPEKTDYDVELSKSPFGIKIVRNNQNRDILLDSSDWLSTSTLLSDQFLQLSFRLYAHQGFGPGEVRTTFPHPLNRWVRSGLWARDGPPMENANLYGVHNFFLGMDYEGSAFGIFLLNSNAQEVALTPLPALTYRTVGGILDFFILTGPKPADVISQYYKLIGHPSIPPYWALGFHLCRYGYENLTEVIETVERNRKAGIPLEAQWIDIDYMDAYKIWTVDNQKFGDLGKFVREKLHAQYGMKTVLIVDPAVSTQGGPDYRPYTWGLELGVFINDSETGQPILGTVWPGETVFPDFSHPNADQWWFDLANTFHNEVQFDALWIDMNEPASFNWGSTKGCNTDDRLNKPFFVPLILDRSLYAKTVCPSAQHYNTTHYNRHNLYGYDHARVTNQVLRRVFPGKRPFLLSRSTFAGSGRYTIHWTGDNLSSWPDMRASIAQMINFNMYGIPMTGADVCGFRDDSTEELCIRWSQLGAFYPFSRNHNALASLPQDPAAWSKTATMAIRDALTQRYILLPYFYTLFFRSHFDGATVIRALAFEFPEDLGTHAISDQFMLGSCILITPVLDEGRVEVDGYVPAGDWINLSTGLREYSRGQQKYFKAPLNVIPILVRGGCVLPLQKNFSITSVSRKQGLVIFAVLSSVDDGTHSAGAEAKANGELFWDDGESDPLNYIHVTFTVRDRVLIIAPKPSHTDTLRRLDPEETELKSIFVSGITQKPSSVELNEKQIAFSLVQDSLLVDCPKGTKFTSEQTLTWSFD